MAVIFDIDITQSDFTLLVGHAPRENHMAARDNAGRQPVDLEQIQVDRQRYRLAAANKTSSRRNHIALFGITLNTQAIAGYIDCKHLKAHTVLGREHSRNLHRNPLIKSSLHHSLRPLLKTTKKAQFKKLLISMQRPANAFDRDEQLVFA